MQRMVLSTDHVPEAERFSYWREAVGEGLLGTSAERNKGQETLFNARVDASIGASFARFRFRTDGYSVFRRPRDIARLSWDDYFCLYRKSTSASGLARVDASWSREPGDLVIGDRTTPFASKPAQLRQ